MFLVLNGDCLNQNATAVSGYGVRPLKIRHGNGVPVVVRGWESQLHGEAEQFICHTEYGRVREALRNPNEVLTSLGSKARNREYRYERLYRNLYNPNFYLLAYQNIYNNGGSMTKGLDGETLSGMGMERIERIIKKLRDGSYKPTPVRRQYIPKANGKKRPLGIPSADDKLVQEVMRLLLEAIYEPTFDSCSHGFRPKRSCHTALKQIQRTYTGIKWFIEGDIKGCFDNIDQHILTGIIRKRIKDEQFMGLVWKFLRAGYMEDRQYNATYSGSAQGSIISPILANLYMNELDIFMREYKAGFDKGQRRSDNAEYSRRKAQWYKTKQSLRRKWDMLNGDERNKAAREVEEKRQRWITLPCVNPMDAAYRRLTYCRYADDFLIGVIGNRKDAEKARSDIREFIADKLNLELSVEKTLITHAAKKARFLGYDVTTSQPRQDEFVKRRGARFRRTTGVIKLYVPTEKWRNRLLENGMMVIRTDENNKERWKPVARSSFVNRSPVEIVGGFNAEIRGLYNYYALANNVSVLNKYSYIAEYSMYHTFAAKYRRRMTQVIARHMKDGVFGIQYVTPKGTEKRIEFYHDGFKKKAEASGSYVDTIPAPVTIYNFKSKELIVRLLKGQCEWCGDPCEKPKVRQVKRLSALRQDVEWQALMLKKRRVAIVLCEACYMKTEGQI